MKALGVHSEPSGRICTAKVPLRTVAQIDERDQNYPFTLEDDEPPITFVCPACLASISSNEVTHYYVPDGPATPSQKEIDPQ